MRHLPAGAPPTGGCTEFNVMGEWAWQFFWAWQTFMDQSIGIDETKTFQPIHFSLNLIISVKIIF